MQKTRIYTIQILGIIMLLCGYFLSDQPDSLSVMHFNPNPDCPSVFTKATKTVDHVGMLQVSSNSQNNPSKKSRIPKFISYELMLPVRSMYTMPVYETVSYAIPLPENYSYLFYEEINPPPPKSC